MARSSLTSVVFASCLLLPIKDRILGNANEKTQPDPYVFIFIPRVLVFETFRDV